ncbi:hypothetical protein HYZ98_02060 [Candidatus Peregrinibacteria bacterium]|nr:hypothetical protein [Candidatus Peregrinibacteria bacterium]
MAWSPAVQDFFKKEADDAVGSFGDDLNTLVSQYCMDPGLARTSVDGFLSDLPRHSDPHVDGYIAWTMIQQSAEILARYAREAQLLLEGKDPIAHDSLTPEDKTPAVDDNAIRESAGLDKDDEVADSSLTDKAQEFDITDDDIGRSARGENFVYKDPIFNVPDPATVYRRATRHLFSTIITQCLGTPPPQRLEVLIQHQVLTKDQVMTIVSEMRRKLDRGLKIPKIDDQMS